MMTTGFRFSFHLAIRLLVAVGCVCVLAACASDSMEGPSPPQGTALAKSSVGPGIRDTSQPPPPSPTLVPGGDTSTLPGSGTAARLPEANATSILSSTTVVRTSDSGWTTYDSINSISGLAFAPDGTLWAATSDGGLVHWDLDAGTYVRYLLQARGVVLAPDGALWLWTWDTLCRFDGTSCQPHTDEEGLLASGIRAVTVSSDGTVWVGTSRGVSRYDGEAWHSYPSEVSTNDLAVTADGNVWAATSGGVGRWLASEDRWITYTGAHGLPSPSTNAGVVGAGPKDEVWVYILWEGVYHFVAAQNLNPEDGRWDKIDGVSGQVSDIGFAPDGTPWVSSAGGLHNPGGSLVYQQDGVWIDVTGQEELVSIRPIALGPGGKVAAGTMLGLGIYEAGGWRLFRDGPTAKAATAVAATPDGAIWLGFGDHSVSTPGLGVSRFHPGEGWQYLLDDEEVTVLATAPDGSLWAGAGCTIRRFTQGSWETLLRCGGDVPAGNILDISFSSSDRVWVANGFALLQFDGQAWTAYNKLIHSVEAAPDGSVWVQGWQGTQGSYFVARFDGLDWTYYELKDAPVRGLSVRAMTPDGALWGFWGDGDLVSFNGVSWTDPDSWRSYPVPPELSDSFRGMAVAPDGSIWVGSQVGAARFDLQALPDDPWTLYPVTPDLTTGLGPGLTFAGDGSFWFGATRLQP